MKLVIFVAVLLIFEIYGESEKKPSSCPTITVPFASIRLSHLKNEDITVAQVLCDSGFYIASNYSNILECEGDRWNHPIPRCIQCKSLRTPTNSIGKSTSMGNGWDFFCRQNYERKGAFTLRCISENVWDNPLPTCLPANMTSPATCDFEHEDMCGWNHDPNHNFDWDRTNNGIMISYDHTKGYGNNGYFMQMFGIGVTGEAARLISPVYNKPSSQNCTHFDFWYYILGHGSLKVYVKKVNEPWSFQKKDVLIEKKEKSFTKYPLQWLNGRVNLGVIDDDYQIIIEGTPNFDVIEGVDDVKVIEDCSLEETTTPTSTTDTPTTIGVTPTIRPAPEPTTLSHDLSTTPFLNPPTDVSASKTPQHFVVADQVAEKTEIGPITVVIIVVGVVVCLMGVFFGVHRYRGSWGARRVTPKSIVRNKDDVRFVTNENNVYLL